MKALVFRAFYGLVFLITAELVVLICLVSAYIFMRSCDPDEMI